MSEEMEKGKIPPGVVYFRVHHDDRPVINPSWLLDACKHMKLDMDAEARKIYCRLCHKELDPFWVIDHFRKFYDDIERKIEAINEFNQKEAARRKRERERRDKRHGSGAQ